MKIKNLCVLSLISFTIITSSCLSFQNGNEDPVKEGMIKVTLLYANGEGKTFDMDYYKNKHMPMVADLLSPAIKLYRIDEGMRGRTSEDPLPYLAIGYLYFDKLSDYEEVFGPNATQIVGDIPNYTNIQPTVQISRVIK